MVRSVARWLAGLIAVALLAQVAWGQSSSRSLIVRSGKGGGKLGVMIQDVTPKLKEKKGLGTSSGAYVSDVESGSAADKAGIEEGDVIVKFKDREISDASDLTTAVQKSKAGAQVSVELMRKEARKTVEVKLGKSDAPRAFSYSFGGDPFMKIPKIPKMNLNMRVITQQDFNGMQLQELTKQLADYFEVPGRRGLLVVSVEKGSDAEKAGVKAGDVITKVNASTVADMEDLRDEMDAKSGKDVPVDVLRKGKTVSLSLHLTDEAEDSEEDYDDDAAVIAPLPACPPDHARLSMHEKIFSRDFLSHLFASVSELKTRILQSLERVAEEAKMTLARFSDSPRPLPGPAHQS